MGFEPAWQRLAGEKFSKDDDLRDVLDLHCKFPFLTPSIFSYILKSKIACVIFIHICIMIQKQYRLASIELRNILKTGEKIRSSHFLAFRAKSEDGHAKFAVQCKMSAAKKAVMRHRYTRIVSQALMDRIHQSPFSYSCVLFIIRPFYPQTSVYARQLLIDELGV